MGSDYSTSAVGFNSVPNVSAVAPGQVIMPYQMTAPYPCDEFVSSRREKKGHTGLIATVVGLLAAGGAIYACKGKSEGAQKIVTATKKFATELSEGFKKLFDDISKLIKGEKSLKPSKEVTEARTNVPAGLEAAVKKAEDGVVNPAIKAVDEQIKGIIKPAQGASKISEATLKEIDKAEDVTAKLGVISKRIEELKKIDPKDLTKEQQEELGTLTRLQELLECRNKLEQLWLNLLKGLNSGSITDAEKATRIKALGKNINKELDQAKVELPKAAETPKAEEPKPEEPKEE